MSKKAKAGIRRKQGPGRPETPPLERARRQALKAKRQLEAFRSEFDEAMALDARSESEAEEVKALADKRLAAAKKVNDVLKTLKAARKDSANKVAGAATRLKAAKAKEKKARQELRSLPFLGFTQAEWDEGGIHTAQTGRPQLETEIKLIRAQEDLDEAMEDVLAQEKAAGVKHIPLSELKDPVKASKGKGLGRPSLDPLGILDRNLSEIERKIARIQEEDPEPKKASGETRGRKPKTKAAKLKEARQKAATIRKQIELKEAELDDIGRIERELKKFRDERRRMNLVIRDYPENCEVERNRSQYLSDLIEEKEAELSVLREESGLKQGKSAKKQVKRKPKVAAKSKRAPKPAVEDNTKVEVDLNTINTEVSAATTKGASKPNDPAEMSESQLAKLRLEAKQKAIAIEAKFLAKLEAIENNSAFDEDETADMIEVVKKKFAKERSNIENINLIDGLPW